MSAARIGAVVALLAVAGCGETNVRPEDPINARIAKLDDRVAQVERVVNNQSLLELATRIDELRGEVNSLRGELEKLQHDAGGSADRSKQLYVDLDARLRALEAGAQPAAASAPAATETNGGDQAAYDAAFDLLKQSRYEQARAAFTQFLKANPTGKLADNAQFWLGETFYVTKGFKQALAEFNKVIKSFPESNKLPDAWLRVGYCDYELGQFEAARKALGVVVEKYPDSDAAKRAQARLKQMTAEKH